MYSTVNLFWPRLASYGHVIFSTMGSSVVFVWSPPQTLTNGLPAGVVPELKTYDWPGLQPASWIMYPGSPNGPGTQSWLVTLPKSFPVICCVALVGVNRYPFTSSPAAEQTLVPDGDGWVWAQLPEGGTSQTVYCDPVASCNANAYEPPEPDVVVLTSVVP